MQRYHAAHLEEEEERAPLSWAVAAGALYPVKCGEDPLIMAVAAGDHGGGGGGLSHPVKCGG